MMHKQDLVGSIVIRAEDRRESNNKMPQQHFVLKNNNSIGIYVILQ